MALSAALDHPPPGGDDSWRWLTPLELSVSLTSWFPAPWTLELFAQTLRRQHRDGPAQSDATWRWLRDPDFSAEPDQSGWTILRFERGNTVGKLPGDRALTLLWTHHFRKKFAFPLAHKVDSADLTALAPASLAIITADRTDATLPYRASWRAQRQAALTDLADDHPSAS